MKIRTLIPSIGTLMLLIGAADTALAGQNAFRSVSGDTVFPSTAFSCAGYTVHYTTHYQGKSFAGTLWVKSPAGLNCEGGRGRVVQGYFEEWSQNSGDWCQGQLKLYLLPLPDGSYAEWSNIRAVPGYHCSGVGMAPKLPLRYAAY